MSAPLSSDQSTATLTACLWCGHVHDPEDGRCDAHANVGIGRCQCPGDQAVVVPLEGNEIYGLRAVARWLKDGLHLLLNDGPTRRAVDKLVTATGGDASDEERS